MDTVLMNCYRCATPLPDNSRFCLSCGADVSGASGERTQPVEFDARLLAQLRSEIADDYSIERELGRGGMAVVFLAIDRQLGRKVALKVLPPQLTFGASNVERFKREARTAATLDHPHIVTIHQISKGGQLFWYAMKYLEGESLAEWLTREGPADFERLAVVIEQAAQALSYAHGRGVIHRDVKPANIMLDPNGWVTVTDFGIAKALGTQSLTGPGSLIGTPQYMSPEQCAGRKVTGAADQYSLGIVAYQMLTGHLPFTGEAVDIIKKQCMDPPPPISVLRPETPDAAVAVVERALEKVPEARFPTVRAFSEALSAAIHGKPVELARPRGSTQSVPRRQSVTAVLTPLPEVLGPTPPEAVRAVEATSAAPQAAPRPPRQVLGPVLGVVVGAGLMAGMVFGVWPRLADRPASVMSPDSQPGSQAQGAVGQASAPDAPAGAAIHLDSAGTDSAQPGSSPVPTGGSEPSTSASPGPARLVLSGVPRGATVTRDGQRVRGTTVTMTPDRRHVVNVSLAGFETWSDTLNPRAGERLSRTVALRPVPASPQAAAVRPPQPVLAESLPRAAASAPPASPATGRLSVGSNPRSSISINGVPVGSYPVRNYTVPAGPVRIVFWVTDSTGTTWSVDTTVTVAPGDNRVLGYVRLTRRP